MTLPTLPDGPQKTLRRVAIGLHWFVGVGAMAGGFAAITNPSAPMGMSADALKNSPFHDFLIPGIILFALLGLGNVACAALFHRKTGLRWYASGVLGGILVVWIVVQCVMLRAVAGLHVIFFALGGIQAAIAAVVLFMENRFPFTIVREWLGIETA